MVKPYLSRLRPAETGPRLHPRPRSRFEPARRFPIDGPAIGSLGLSLPPESEAGAVGAEMESSQTRRTRTSPVRRWRLHLAKQSCDLAAQ